MKKRSLLIRSILSVLLLTSTLSAQNIQCTDGNCFIDINKLTPAKSVKSKIYAFKTLKKPLSPTIKTIILEPSKYIMSDAEKVFFQLDEPTIYNDENTIVLAHSKYVMTEEEKTNYYEEERLEELEKEEIIEPIILVEEKIIEKSTLPTSDFFCEVPKHAEYHPETNSYECV